MELEDLPDEKDFWSPGMPPRRSWPKYYNAMIEWLKQTNLTQVEVKTRNIEVDWGDSYEILSGPSPRDKNILHACVGYAGKIVHDPHPSKEGLMGSDLIWIRTYFVVCDPKFREYEGNFK